MSHRIVFRLRASQHMIYHCPSLLSRMHTCLMRLHVQLTHIHPDGLCTYTPASITCRHTHICCCSEKAGPCRPRLCASRRRRARPWPCPPCARSWSLTSRPAAPPLCTPVSLAAQIASRYVGISAGVGPNLRFGCPHDWCLYVEYVSLLKTLLCMGYSDVSKSSVARGLSETVAGTTPSRG